MTNYLLIEKGNKIKLGQIIIGISMLYLTNAQKGDSQRGLIAYDCTADTVNITSMSLVDIEPCKNEWDNITTTSTNIQVVQTVKIFDTHVYQCKVVFRRRIQHCGMHSYTSAYQGSYKYTLKPFTSEECRKLHETGSLGVHNHVFIHELQRNNSMHGEVLVTGKISISTCEGGDYYDGTTYYYDALVTVEYDIDLYDYQAKIDLTERQML